MRPIWLFLALSCLLMIAAWATEIYAPFPNSISVGHDIRISEQADHSSTPGSGYGYLWVDTSHQLTFTDSNGTDTVLGAGGGITALTGDVTASGSGSVAATIASGAVDIAMLSATGTADGTTFLRGDNTWATPAGSGDMVLAGTQTVTGAKTFDDSTLILAGSTSGTTTLKANATAGTTVATFQAATGTVA